MTKMKESESEPMSLSASAVLVTPARCTSFTADGANIVEQERCENVQVWMNKQKESSFGGDD